MPPTAPTPPLRIATSVLRALLPIAERDEVLDDLRDEYARRRGRNGRAAAGLWLWRQVLGSAPALLRRSWWRGWTGFEPKANRWLPGGPLMESWILDLRYSARRLWSRPTYTLLAVLTLALGVGGTAAIFSIVRGTAPPSSEPASSWVSPPPSRWPARSPPCSMEWERPTPCLLLPRP